MTDSEVSILCDCIFLYGRMSTPKNLTAHSTIFLKEEEATKDKFVLPTPGAVSHDGETYHLHGKAIIYLVFDSDITVGPLVQY